MRDRRLIEFAKQMRREQTEPETRLWLELRAARFQGIKFRRQKVIGPYIADFSSREPMLVIEIDGDTHAGQEAYDRARTAYFEEQGYRVIRFTNRDMLTNMDGVLEQLASFLTPPLPTLSPEGERAL
ncbi:MAG: endonuclease domain-containing protein [Sphingopyxis granuli]|uniref:endonuclease domain-containing protein n=2 Tax=Sphingopyxis granuli TaxID=267128 RepID=UPI001BAFB771|nr:endonuclease domain-containing protein [Sphingopyxis granuli]QUM71233.1 endonuclease domain-containing protein [Sphingopyxis granuli]